MTRLLASIGRTFASFRTRELSVILALVCAALGATAAANPSAGVAELAGMKVHYSTYGSGPDALVLVHGWMCDRTFWDAQVKVLGERTRVIAIDLLGHGESEKPQINYTMQLHADAIAAVMRHAEVEGATLVGHSNGTPVIREFYRKYPEMTRALVIVDGALRPFAEKAETEKFIAPLRQPDFHAAVTPLIDAMLRPMKDVAMRERIKSAMLVTPQFVAVSEMEAITDAELWRPDKINVPTLVILAKQPAWTTDYERFVRELIPNVDYQVWPGVSHFLMMDKPAEFNAAMAAFFANNQLVAN